MEKIIFVYNADSGLFNGIKDLIHKNLSPSTYPCSLCTVTYDNLGMRREWKQFLHLLDQEVEFLHRDELADRYGIRGIRLPAALKQRREGVPEIWLTADLIDSCQSLADLQKLVSAKMG